jgi:hypothetical protein
MIIELQKQVSSLSQHLRMSTDKRREATSQNKSLAPEKAQLSGKSSQLQEMLNNRVSQ